MGPVQSRHQNRELRRRQNNRAVLNRRKDERAFFEPFCHQDHPGAVQKIILSRSFRFDLKTKTLPQYGSAPNACATIATKPWTPRRKSIGRDATNTFKSPRRPITTRDAARPTQPKASWRQRPREHERARQPSQSQSSVGAMPIQARLQYRPSHSSWQSLRTSLRGRTGRLRRRRFQSLRSCAFSPIM